MANASKVKDKVSTATPVVKQLASDEEFRRTVVDAFSSARDVYDKLGDDKRVQALATRIATDPKLQKELTKQFKDVQKAAKKATKRSHKKRNALIMAGIVIGLLYNPATGPQTRRWLRERVKGGDEAFDYELADAGSTTPSGTTTGDTTTGDGSSSTS
jgi:hypothetical protein